MRHKAIYLGLTELGFTNGQTYEIKIKRREVEIIPLGEVSSHIYVYDVNSTAWHPYKDEEEMMKNWRFINENSY